MSRKKSIMSITKPGRYFSPRDVARLFMVSPITVRSWAEKGWLSAETTAGGHRRYLQEEVERFAIKRGLKFKRDKRAATQVLIVDDDPELAAYLAVALQGAVKDMETRVAYDGFEAGLLMRQSIPDVLLLDLLMPHMDGFQVCKRIKSDPELRDVRIIAMTGHPSAENYERIMAAGAEHCLSKPLDLNELYKALQPQKNMAAPAN